MINDAALDYMRQRKVAPDVISKLAAHRETSFASQMAWYDHLVRLRLDGKRDADPLLPFLS